MRQSSKFFALSFLHFPRNLHNLSNCSRVDSIIILITPFPVLLSFPLLLFAAVGGGTFHFQFVNYLLLVLQVLSCRFEPPARRIDYRFALSRPSLIWSIISARSRCQSPGSTVQSAATCASLSGICLLSSLLLSASSSNRLIHFFCTNNG